MSRRLEWAGITAAIRVQDVENMRQDELRTYFRDLGQQAVEQLRQAVGGIPLRSEPIVRIDGPDPDPIQGLIYALSVSAQVDVDELPPGSTMHAAYQRHAPLTTGEDPIL